MKVRSARAEHAVPPGQLGFDPSAPRCLLYTLQSVEAFGELQATRRLVPDPARADPDWSHVYPWMVGQMNERLSTQGNGAVWLWARTPRRELVDQCRREPGAVLLTCLVPRDRVLASHFDDWHCALNCAPLVHPLAGELDSETDERWVREYEEIESELLRCGTPRFSTEYGGWPGHVRDRLERSWEIIFDVDRYPVGDRVQATVHELRVGHVRRAVRIL